MWKSFDHSRVRGDRSYLLRTREEAFGTSAESCFQLQFSAVAHPSSGLRPTCLVSGYQSASSTWTLKGRNATNCLANALRCECGARGTQDQSNTKLKQKLWDLTEMLSMCRSGGWVRRMSNEAADTSGCIKNILLKWIKEDDHDRWLCSVPLLIEGLRSEWTHIYSLIFPYVKM